MCVRGQFYGGVGTGLPTATRLTGAAPPPQGWTGAQMGVAASLRQEEGAMPTGIPCGVASQMRSPWHTAQEMPARVRVTRGDGVSERRWRQDSR